jgi:hypothetical protein
MGPAHIHSTSVRSTDCPSLFKKLTCALYLGLSRQSCTTAILPPSLTLSHFSLPTDCAAMLIHFHVLSELLPNVVVPFQGSPGSVRAFRSLPTLRHPNFTHSRQLNQEHCWGRRPAQRVAISLSQVLSAPTDSSRGRNSTPVAANILTLSRVAGPAKMH